MGITLNVGGTNFTTTVATLTQYPYSNLAAMIDPQLPPDMTDDKGYSFIDRDPKPFEVILSYLRSGVLPEDIVGCSLQQVELEADYYGLEELLRIIDERMNAKEKEEEERPKMSSTEYDEKALEMLEKAADLKRKKGQMQGKCCYYSKCYECKVYEKCCKLATEYEKQAADLRRRGY